MSPLRMPGEKGHVPAAEVHVGEQADACGVEFERPTGRNRGGGDPGGIWKRVV